MENPEAIFDVLYIGEQIEDKFEDFGTSEIQFIAYLSCLLSLYDGHPIDEWNYQFIKSDLGSPYSSKLHGAINILNNNGHLEHVDNENSFFRISETGYKSLSIYSQLHTFQKRKKFLETACNSFDVLPFGYVKIALNNDPILSSANNSLDKRTLLLPNSPATSVLHSNFKILKLALGDEFKDLITPAIVWIESLLKKDEIINA